MQEELEAIKSLLEKAIGLNAKIISDKAWERIIHERMAICDIKSIEDYVARLKHSHIELQECVEVLVVPETWFFRDRAGIDYVCQYACGKWLPEHKDGKFSILSLPCSSGEEPYSIAMEFTDNFFPANRLHIDGVDISKKVLTKAGAGEYGRNSFRSKDTSYRDRYFTESKSKGEYSLNPGIKKLVNFSYGNLLDGQLALGRGTYDAIFCRNLFIYFHPKAQSLGFDVIKNLLKSSGFLLVGLAEVELARKAGFESCGPAKAGAFKLASRKSTPVSRLPIETPAGVPVIVKPSASIKPQEEAPKTKPTANLQEARRLADAGKSDEALAICNEYILTNTTDASAYFLLGLIMHAIGDEMKAEQNFLKTVYLDANFYEALVYLSLLAERKGDFTQAELYRTRAERSQMKIKNK